MFFTSAPYNGIIKRDKQYTITDNFLTSFIQTFNFLSNTITRFTEDPAVPDRVFCIAAGRPVPPGRFPVSVAGRPFPFSCFRPTVAGRSFPPGRRAAVWEKTDCCIILPKFS